MREIKFRAWDKKGKKFVKSNKVEHQIIPTKATKNGFEIKSSFILMQFTGLKDKNGKEIYEGDILGYRDKRKNFMMLIEYEKHYCEEYGDIIGFQFDEDLEIIGNIYENPELLK